MRQLRFDARVGGVGRTDIVDKLPGIRHLFEIDDDEGCVHARKLKRYGGGCDVKSEHGQRDGQLAGYERTRVRR